MKTDELRKIHMDQIGYMPYDKKIAVVTEKNTSGCFYVISVPEGNEVYEGKLVGPVESKVAEENNYLADFSEVIQEGRYKLIIPGIDESYEFSIEEHVYSDTFKDAVKFFYMQRCGEEIPKKYGGIWAHPKCHMQKAVIYGTDQSIDVCGGWHDAGDYGRYILASAKAIADLLLAYESNKKVFFSEFDIPRRRETWPYVLEEVASQLKWMLKMQDPISGGVYHKVTGATFPPHHFMPEEETHELIVCPISTEATGSFAGVMAMGYKYLKELDSEFADSCLAAAERAWDYLKKMPSQTFTNPNGIITGQYGGKTDSGQRLWASAQLFNATGKETYKQAAEEIMNQEEMVYAYDWSKCGAYGRKAYLSAKGADAHICEVFEKRIIGEAELIMQLTHKDSYGITDNADAFVWGSNMYFLMCATMLMDAYTIEQDERYVDQAKEYVHYCFGKNPLGICFITGYGSHRTKNPHYRPAMAKGEAPVGMLAGGANIGCQDEVAQQQLKAKGIPAAKCYIDDCESFATNEVDIYWNSMLVYVMARVGMI